ncbi:hypothetical protein [Litchfieldia salsa]|uniref:Spore coat protein n=1 Tax=Litchfieldia salsa TaxID=930152 RepID=A0A1H0RV95_9BACI|nr:hypothetical protein [Litchfieldia salsa]SDP33335.1 hypothetical protein SAMN05216565_102398 [Litchfieldia salsa]
MYNTYGYDMRNVPVYGAQGDERFGFGPLSAGLLGLGVGALGGSLLDGPGYGGFGPGYGGFGPGYGAGYGYGAGFGPGYGGFGPRPRPGYGYGYGLRPRPGYGYGGFGF